MGNCKRMRGVTAYVAHLLNVLTVAVLAGAWLAHAWGDEAELRTGVLCNDRQVALHLKERFEHRGAHGVRAMLAVHQGRSLAQSGTLYKHLQDSWCEEASVRREGLVVGVLEIEPGMQYFLKGGGGVAVRGVESSRRAVRRMYFFQLRHEDGAQVELAPSRTSVEK